MNTLPLVNKVTIIIGAVVSLSVLFLLFPIGLYFFWIPPNTAIYNDESCLKIASTEVLGKDRGTCPRYKYLDEVENLGLEDKHVAIFKFQPKSGNEKNCPPIKVIVDRVDGEGWVGE